MTFIFEPPIAERDSLIDRMLGIDYAAQIEGIYAGYAFGLEPRAGWELGLRGEPPWPFPLSVRKAK